MKKMPESHRHSQHFHEHDIKNPTWELAGTPKAGESLPGDELPEQGAMPSAAEAPLQNLSPCVLNS